MFEEWTEEGLAAVSRQRLSRVPVMPGDKVETFVELGLGVHVSCRRYARGSGEVGVTPGTLVELLGLVGELGARKSAEVLALRQRFGRGVERLEGAEAEVGGMRAELQRLRPELLATSEKTEALMRQIERETVEVELAKEVVATKEAQANAAATAAQTMKAECEEALAEAIPALDAAVAALNTLRQSDVSYLKTLKHPPHGIKLVMEAVCILLQERPARVPHPSRQGAYASDYWPTASRLLGDLHFLGRIRSLDKDAVPDAVMDVIRGPRYVGSPHMEPSAVRTCSVAAEGMCLWVRAMELYNRIIKVVAPKRAALKKAEAEVKAELGNLALKRADLQAVTQRLQSLNDQFSSMRQRKKELENQIEVCEVKTERAQRLLAGLSEERARWSHLTEELSVKAAHFIGDVFLAAVSIAYLHRFSPAFRQRRLEELRLEMEGRGLPVCEGPFHLSIVLEEEGEKDRWLRAGLPGDPLSLDLALAIAHSRRHPLVLDPQGEAQRWLLRVHGSRMARDSAGDSALEGIADAMALGTPFLLDNVRPATLRDPRLAPLLNLNYITLQSGQRQLEFCGRSVKVADGFRLYLLSQEPKETFGASLLDKVSMVKFVVTREGVEDGLLELFLAQEAPELEERKAALAQAGAESRANLAKLESRILGALSGHGSVLEDEGAVELLSAAKATSQAIQEEQREAAAAEARIDRLRQQWRGVARRGWRLFAALLDLLHLSPHYHFSLAWFRQLFSRTVQAAGEGSGLSREAKAQQIGEELSLRVFGAISQSLFHQHRIVLAFYLLLKGHAPLASLPPADLPAGLKAPDVSQRRGSRFQLAAGKAQLESSRDIDKAFYNEVMTKPQAQRLNTAIAVIERELGPEFLRPPDFHVASIVAASAPDQPILLFDDGTLDPLAQVRSAAEANSLVPEKFLLLGLGMEPDLAEKKIRWAAKEGGWAVMQNAHLAPLALRRSLDKVLHELELSSAFHGDFRMWLTLRPTADFPVALLQRSLKVTVEPRLGVRASLLQSLHSHLRPFVDGGGEVGLGYRACLLHALLVDRAEYGQAGFVATPRLQPSDLSMALAVVGAKADQPKAWLRRLLVEAAYAGHISTPLDQATVATLFGRVFEIRRANAVVKRLMPEQWTLEGVEEAVRGLGTEAEPELCGLPKAALAWRLQFQSRSFSNDVRRGLGMEREDNFWSQEQLDTLIRSIADALKSYHMQKEPESPLLQALSRDGAELVGRLKGKKELLEGLRGKEPSSCADVEWEEVQREAKVEMRRLADLARGAAELSESGGARLSLEAESVGSPERLIAALRHEAARAAGTTLDERRLRVSLAPAADDAQSPILVLRRLRLLNASLSPRTSQLREVKGDQPWSSLPELFVYTEKAGSRAEAVEDVYLCPVLSESWRPSWEEGCRPVLELGLSVSPGTLDHWTVRGVKAAFRLSHKHL